MQEGVIGEGIQALEHDEASHREGEITFLAILCKVLHFNGHTTRQTIHHVASLLLAKWHAPAVTIRREIRATKITRGHKWSSFGSRFCDKC